MSKIIKIDPNPREGYCACGEELHYLDNRIKKSIEEMVKYNGAYVRMVCTQNGKTYLVQRHYIALHGLMAKDLPELGFNTI